MDYTKLSRSELIGLCKQRGIKGYSSKAKPGIIDMLLVNNPPVAEVPQEVPAKPPPPVAIVLRRKITTPADIPAGCDITKEKRHEVFGHVAGGAGAMGPETYQRSKIVEGTGQPCPKTNMRINLRTNTLISIACPNKLPDGFDYSEDFDGVQTIDGIRVYINFKCVVGAGGSQTRSLREVYWFIEGQLKTAGTDGIYFANILDGDQSHSVMSKFEHLRGLPEYVGVKNKVYVGDLRGYFAWLSSIVDPPQVHDV
jgi:hypothetical protein